MRGILRRIGNSGRTRVIRRGIKLPFRINVRVLVIAIILSLLVSSLPVSASKTQNLYSRTIAPGQQNSSFAAQVHGAVIKAVTSFGSWMAGFIEAKPSGPSVTYQPVAAYLTPAPFIDAPANLTVTAVSSSSISLSWTAPGGTIDHYVVERSQSIQGPFFFVANVTGATTSNDTTVTNLNAYLYRVRAVSNTGAVSSPSNIALGTAISFQFSSLAGQQVRAQHFHDVRTAINAVRPLANLPAAVWTRGTLTGLDVKADDVNEMRSALDAALTGLGIPVTAYTDSTLNVGANGTVIKAIHIEQLQTRSTRGVSNSTGPIDSDSATARLDPLNATGGGGENPLSRNFNWNLPLMSLPGRAGMDLGLTLSYNSLVWTRIGGNLISFDDDNGFPGPGFRLGFPVIQQRYFSSEVEKLAYLVINPDGSRTELRQVGTSNFYEAADSSHLLLDENTMILRTTSGTQLSYALHGGEFQCTQIKDRNGNLITISYNVAGRINTITDTLNRVITFSYIDGWLDKITQVWKQGSPNQVTHQWARFEYADTTIDTNFPGLTVFGPADNTSIKTLSKVTLADDSRLEFSYTSWGQVWKVTRFAPNNSVLKYRTYNLPQTGTLAHSDCPRFTERKDWAKYWNGDTNGTTDANEEVATATFIVPVSDSWTMPDNTPASGVRTQVTTPDGTSNKIYFVGLAGTDSGWQRGLAALVETHSGGSLKRTTMTTWTQDDETESFILNPRVKETNVYDPAGNRARTEIVYGDPFPLGNDMSCHLPREVFEYAANASTKLRSTRTLYNMTTTYTSRRLLGLVSEKQLYEGDVTGALLSRTEFFYDNDNGSSSILGTDAPVQHDNTNYTAGFVAGRGNLSSVKRHNVVNGQSTTTRTRYNTAGAVVSTKDASDHETTVSYAESFSDGNNSRNTLAYPTKVTDPDTFESTAKYDFDFGVVTSRRTPKPNETTNVLESQRPEQVFTFDTIGRLQQITNSVNAASTRFEYSTTGNQVDIFTKVQQSEPESHSWEIADGFGRVVATAKDHNASTFSGQKLVYDLMGRVIKTSNPTETSAIGHPSSWSAVGDDASVGWLYTEQTYDWKGRPLVSTNQDGTTKTTSYSGCGCAGGEVVTLTDEGTIDPSDNVTLRKRQKKIYSDVLGRTIKAEVLNWEGGSVHSAVVNTYNARDQIIQVRQFAGPAPSDPGDLSCPSGTCQETVTTYDGFGRLKTKHSPEQQQDTTNNPASTAHTTWDYNADDTIQKITDPRGAVSNFTYNGRHSITNITYTLLPNVPTTGPWGVVSAPAVGFEYDAAGNRKLMNDGMGSVTYTYDQLSRLMSETRQFSSLSGSASGGNYTLGYDYNLANQLTKVTDPNNVQVHYDYDHTGRLDGVTGTGFTNVSTFLSNIQYRAWGAPKSVTHMNNSRTTETTYDARLRVATYKLLPVIDEIRLHNQYEYFPDGRLKKLTDLDDHDPTIIGFTDSGRWFSRVYRYDNLGRIARARGYNQPNGFEFDRPYDLFYGYDSFNHLISRSGKYYYQTNFSDSGSFVNNRRLGWDYGADGQETRSTGPGIVRDHTYNAAGQVVQIKETVTATSQISTYVTSYDGDGNQAKEFLQQDPTNTTSYKVRSSVLGDVVTRLNNAGNKVGTTVHLDERVTATKINSTDTGVVPLPIYNDPLGQSIGGDRKAVYDPLGTHVLWQSSPQSSPPTSYPRSSASFGSLGSLWGNAQESSCQLDGIPTNCDLAMSLVNNGSAMQCQDNDCGPRFVRTTNAFGDPISAVTLPFMAFGDGSFGSFFGGWDETPQEQAAALFADVTFIDGTRHGNNFSPQNPPYDRRADFRDYAVSLSNNNSITDCNKLALLIYKAGQVFGGKNPFEYSGRDIVHGLMAGLTEFTRVSLGGTEGPSNRNFRVGVFRRDPHFGGGFGDSGFGRFQDGGNQVRHFIFYFGAGYGIGERLANEGLYAEEGTREGSNVDVALGWEGTKRGASFDGDAKGLAQDVWRHVCGQTTPLNLP